MTYDKLCDEAECVVYIRGDVDLSCAPELKRLERQLAERERVVVDVAGLRYADTTFLRFLLQLRHAGTKKSEPRAVRLTGVGPNLRRVLEITGLSRVFV